MADGSQSVVAVSKYTAVFKRRLWLVLLLAIGGAVLGMVLIGLQGAAYTSQAVVQVTPIVSQSDDPNLDISRQVETETELAVAASQRVAERAWALREAAETFDDGDVNDPQVQVAADDIEVNAEAARAASEAVEVRMQRDSQVIVFEVTHHKPETAQAIAQSSAVAYLEQRAEAATANTVELRERLEARAEALENRLTEIASTIAVFETENGSVADPASVRAAEYLDIAPSNELAAIGTKFANLESLNINPGAILNDAQVPADSTGLPFLLGPVTGGLLGLAVAMTIVFYSAGSDDRLRPERGELSALGAPMLGTAPYRPARVKVASRLYASNTAEGDSYRRLQGTVLFNLDTEDRTVALVSGVNNATAGTTVASNIAAMVANTGRRTLVVGGDMRNSLLAGFVNTPVAHGLSDVVLGGIDVFDAVVQVEGAPNLWLLGAGNQTDRPYDVFQSNAFGRLMTALQADFDMVVIEAPPVLRVADAVDLASYTDGVILVAEGSSDSRSEVAEALTQLQGVGADVVGVVIAESS